MLRQLCVKVTTSYPLLQHAGEVSLLHVAQEMLSTSLCSSPQSTQDY